MPNTYIETAEYDCLKDEGIEFANKLKDNGINPKYVLVRNRETIAEVERLFGVKTIIEYEKLSDCDLIIIAVKDDAIKEVASRLHNYKGVLVHTSGTQSSSVLNVVENYGIIYPLQTISKDYDIEIYDIEPVKFDSLMQECGAVHLRLKSRIS